MTKLTIYEFFKNLGSLLSRLQFTDVRLVMKGAV